MVRFVHIVNKKGQIFILNNKMALFYYNIIVHHFLTPLIFHLRNVSIISRQV
jgi:hypothetical protein